MIVLLSLIVYIAKGASCFHYLSHGASLHRHSFIFTLVSHIFIASRRNPVTRMRTLAPRLRESKMA